MRRRISVLLLCGLLLTAVPVAFGAEEESCAEISAETSAKIDALSSRLSNDIRRLQRDITALKAQIEKPGLNEAIAGVGYICGLFGVAFFVAARRKK